MSFNGSGVFVINSSGQPVVANTLITSADFNNLTADLATGLSNCITKDGQQTVTANIPFGGFKLTNVANGTSSTDVATLGNILAGTGIYVATVGGTSDVITLTPSPAIAAYAAGQAFWFIASGANTTNVTVAISGLAAKAITKNGTTALVANDIPSGKLIGIRYDGTQFQLVGPGDATYAAQPFTDATAIVKNSSDATKLVKLSASAISASTTRTITAADQDLTMNNLWIGVNDFRLTLTTALPVTTSDVTGAGTLYCTPYAGNRISLYDGTSWHLFNSAEFSLALTLTSGKPYDVFGIITAGAPALEVLVWTNDTTRATTLTTQNGVLVKSGDATRRYLGTLYASGSNTTEDSLAKRYLYNYYHRVARAMKVVEATTSWTYNTATLRQARASAANQLDFVIGVSEDLVQAQVLAGVVNSTGSFANAVGIGLDSTSVNSARVYGIASNTANVDVMAQAVYQAPIAAGRHTLVWLEIADTNVTTTFWGVQANTDVFVQSGITGTVWS